MSTIEEYSAEADVIISVAAVDALWVVIELAKRSLRLGDASRHVLIVPDAQVQIFQRAISGSRIEVLPESDFVNPSQQEALRSRLLAADNVSRYGWYLQQMIKLSALRSFMSHPRLLVWDADTLPTRRLKFFDTLGRPVLYGGGECHEPYFEMLSRAFGVQKIAKESFISQAFPVTSEQLNIFFSAFQDPMNWFEELSQSIDFSLGSGFSEYETLGTIIYQRESPIWQRGRWHRMGNSYTQPHNVDRPMSRIFTRKFDYLAFESWSISPRERVWFKITVSLPNVAEAFVGLFRRIKAVETSREIRSADNALDRVIEAGVEHVVQVGANDGIQSDPLRHHLLVPGRISSCALVEPLPLYAQKLRDLYRNDSRVSVLEMAIGLSEEDLILFSIPGPVADLMNDKVPYDWAHGQGSSDRDVVESWIRKNSWRGPRYVRQIPAFRAAIQSESVRVIPLSDLLTHPTDLVVIDVQGMESEVLESMGAARPRWIYVETDGSSLPLKNQLQALGYQEVAVGDNSLYRLGHLT